MAPLVGAECGALTGRYAPGTALQVGELSCVVKQFLASGGHANVYLVSLMHNGAPRVLKHIPLDDEPERRRLATQEIDFMRALQGHANIVTLDAAEITDGGAFILMEQCAGDVLSLMSASADRMLDESTVLHIFCDVCKAVAHMHYQADPLLHRDLKVENVLIASGAPPLYKLCDFGSASATTIAPGVRLTREQVAALDDELQRMTTLEYRAPEMVDLYMRRGITEKADIWALGVLLYKLCYFRTPFDNAPSLAILNAEYSVPTTPAYSRKLRDIFQMTLREEPRERSNIFALCAYVCALRGEPCLLANKYASPPPSPLSLRTEAQSRRDGLGCVSAQPVHQPRRFAAAGRSSTDSSRSTSALASSRPSSGTPSEHPADRIVPMRRGRPAKPHNAAPPPPKSTTQGLRDLLKSGGSSAAAAGGRLRISDGSAASAPFRRVGSSASMRSGAQVAHTSNLDAAADNSPQARAHTGDGSMPAAQHRRQSSEDAASSSAAATPDPGSESGSDGCGSPVRRPRMSVRAPDGRESMSADFIQGAVFGSARRTSVMRRNPSVISSASASSRLSARGGMHCTQAGAATPTATATNRCSSGTDMSDELPLAAIALAVGAGSRPRTTETAADATVADLPEFVHQPLPPPPPLLHKTLVSSSGCPADDDYEALAAMISPLSLAAPSPGAGSPAEGLSGADHDASRLSTILESHPDEGGGHGIRREAPQPIYEMTLDKLESDMRFSMLLDEQPLLDNAKARYAAQRCSVYQGADSYFGRDGQIAMAQADWQSLPPEALGGMLQRFDEQTAQGSAWPQPVPEAAADAIDVDTVLQRAGKRNRQRLIAQNNRRSLYIAGTADGIRQEDVDANMRVLTEREMDELLKRMDMYNRELLWEQQRWQTQKPGATGPITADMWSLDRILELANDQMLRSEQDSLGAAANNNAAPPPKVASAPGGILHSVVSAAKSTFGRQVPARTPEEPAPAAPPAAPVPAPLERPEPEAPPTESIPVATAPRAPEPPVSPVLAPPLEPKPSSSPEAASSTVVPSTVVPSTVAPSAPAPATPAPATPAPATPAPATPAPATPEPVTPAVAAENGAVAAGDTAAAGKTAADAVGAAQPKPPGFGRARSDTATRAAADPLADLRARLKKKKSSPSLPTQTLAPPALPTAPPAAHGKPPKSVKNLVAMFDKS